MKLLGVFYEIGDAFSGGRFAASDAVEEAVVEDDVSTGIRAIVIKPVLDALVAGRVPTVDDQRDVFAGHGRKVVC